MAKGSAGPGIGCGSSGKCGKITISNTVTKVVATKSSSGILDHIGKYNADSSVGTITFGNKLKKTYSNGNLTLTLQPAYIITWKNDNGTTLETDTEVIIGTMPTYNGATPTKASTAQYTYTFAGWSPTVVAATADKTYTATYNSTVRSYVVTWKDEDGTTLQTDSVEYGTVPSYGDESPMKESTAQYSYSFAGWDAEVVAVTGTATYTATYNSTVRSYAITWKNEDGTTLRTDTLQYGATPSYGGTPTKEATSQYAYEFAGWNSEVVTVTGEATYTATYRAIALKPDAPVIFPKDGTVFQGSLSVSMTCSTEGATIHYTTNGTEPTAESPVYRRFKIYGKTTVKAVAEKNGLLSDVVTAEYALGQCADPVFSLADGTEFEHSNQEVSIAWNNDGVLRYTLDGSDPTAESPIYEEPFSFSESVVVKAKVFSDDFFDSSVVTANLTRVWVNVTTPVIDASSSFTGSKTKVSISCATEGAIVRYTLNGNEPNSHSTKYTGPFYVTESCTVKAYATMPDYLKSEVATFAIEKVWVIGDTMGKPDHGFATDGNGGAGWTRVVDATAPNGEAMKSGAITHDQSSVLSTTVMGPGTLSFSWRTSCEQDDEYEWDHAELVVDGVVKLRLNGVTGWTAASVEITSDGEHTVEWRYIKDDVESAGEDAAWVANYNWASDWTATRTTEVPVPYAWLTAHDPDVVDEYEIYEAAAKKMAANGNKVWECYVVGLDPREMDVFRITSFPMKSDGTPDFDNITIYPPQSQWNVSGATPVVNGAETVDGEWHEVDKASEAEKAKYRFYKVVVELP